MLLAYCRENNDRSVAIRTLMLIQLMPSLTDLALGLVTLAVRCRDVGARRRTGGGNRARRSLTLFAAAPSPRRRYGRGHRPRL